MCDVCLLFDFNRMASSCSIYQNHQKLRAELETIPSFIKDLLRDYVCPKEREGAKSLPFSSNKVRFVIFLSIPVHKPPSNLYDTYTLYNSRYN